jgi:hypothetical protein
VAGNIDYQGARGSNAGDQFHELWTLLRVLELLNTRSPLQAVGVEGVRTIEEVGVDLPTWDGVDVALYYGATVLEKVDRIEFVQLKYSSANPETSWSIARLTANSAKTTNNSVIRRLADDYVSAKTRLKPGAILRIRLVSNQEVSARVAAALAAHWTGDLAQSGFAQSLIDDIEALRTATDLSITDFLAFLSCLDFSECGPLSRFTLKEKIVALVSEHLGDDVSSEIRELQVRVRELMLPERAREVVTGKDVLLWFGLSARDGLFPCEPDIRIPKAAIRRPVSETIVERLSSQRVTLVHGPGGCGKTTLMNQIVDDLPAGSVSIIFDCFGGGRYIYSDDKRHLPENAFLQLTNEVAVALNLPLFLPRDLKRPANVRSFIAKLRTAGRALEQLEPSAILLIAIDAADNSVSAAAAVSPPERSFVFDLVSANLTELPENVRFLISSRTARRDFIKSSSSFAEVECPVFSRNETRQHLMTVVADPRDALIDQFHALSHGNPRVQAYALAVSAGDKARVLDALRPGGKSLPDVLRATFDTALRKLGQTALFDRLVAALAFLPAPANISAIASVADSTVDIVRDWALDLTPGLREHDGNVSIADEDFETFIKEAAAKDGAATIERIADRFLSTFISDPYSALHVADALVSAGRAPKLLEVIEADPQVKMIGDPVLRRQIQVRRLWLALATCRHAGSPGDALKTILISAEAEKDESTLASLLEEQLDLAVEFGGTSLRRTILLDRDRLPSHGAFLAQDAARAGRAGDSITTREQLHFHDAWLRRRSSIPSDQLREWGVDEGDVAARVEAILVLAGPLAAYHELMRWTPREIALRVGYRLVPQLIARGHSKSLRAIVDKRMAPAPWDLIIWTMLAMSGQPVDAAALERSLRRMRRRYIPDPQRFRASYGEDNWEKQFLNTLVLACELGYHLGLEKPILRVAVERIVNVIENKKRKLYGSDFHRFDALLRCSLLLTVLSGEDADVEKASVYFKSFIQTETPPALKGRKKKPKTTRPTEHSGDRDQEQLDKKLRALFRVYAARIALLSPSLANSPDDEEHLASLGSISGYSYDLDYDHDSGGYRAVAARAVMDLLVVPHLKGADLENRANALLRGRYADWLASRRVDVWEQLRFRGSEASSLIHLVSAAATEVRDAKASASEKLEAMVRLARLLFPVSRHDSEALFNEAISIAKEIDHEAVDQIEFAAAAAAYAQLTDQESKREGAARFFAFVTGVSERLSGREFSWEAGVRALTLLDVPCAMAASSRWADDGAVSLTTTLNVMLAVALRRGLIEPKLAVSLLPLIRDVNIEVYGAVARRVATDPSTLDEIARDALLFTAQQSRGNAAKAIIDETTAVTTPGPWLVRLSKTLAFIEANQNRSVTKDDDFLEPPTGRRGDPVKEFVFEPTGPFRSVESIEQVLRAAAESGLIHSDRALLGQMLTASSDPNNRIAFLDALVALSDDAVWPNDRANTILEAVTLWKSSPAVDHWCRERLPDVIVSQFHAFSQWLKQGQKSLPALLALTKRNAAEELAVILEGVAVNGRGLGSRALFGVAETICARIDPASLGNLLIWYIDRLVNRLPAASRTNLYLQQVPLDTDEAASRLIYAQMSDIDTRVRWRAAHSLRRSARLQLRSIVESTVALRNRMQDDAFRLPGAPYYFLAARMWLALALYRISAETPSMLSGSKDALVDLTLSEELPHAGIREYAKRTILTLAERHVLILDETEQTAVRAINTALKGKINRKPNHGEGFDRQRERQHRFKFDEMDTIPYWFRDIPRIFPTVSLEHALNIADKWILDKWGAEPEANWWDKEPRKGRYDERRYGLWSHRHGSMPTIERYGTYLEWHAIVSSESS